jgi:hypothetical protein
MRLKNLKGNKMKCLNDLCRFVGLTLLITTVVATADQGEKQGSHDIANFATADMTDFALKLALIEGHLWVATELVKQGHLALGNKHSKHPAQEVYTELKPLLASIDSRGFADELERMSAHLQNQEIENFQKAYLDAVKAINSIHLQMSLTLAQKLELVFGLLKQAYIEYNVGVVEGAVLDAQEYQDARGFTHVAGVIVRGLNDGSDTQLLKKDLTQLLARFSTIDQLWPNLKGDGAISIGSESLGQLVEHARRIRNAHPQ